MTRSSLAERGRCGLDLAVHLGEVLAGVVRERLGEQLLLRVEVVVDEAARDVEPLGDVGDASAREAPLDDDLARGLEDLGAPLVDRLLLHCQRTLSLRHERIEDPLQSCRVISDGQLLEDADAVLGRSVWRHVRRVAQRLHVDVLARAGRVDRYGDPLEATTDSPFHMPCPNSGWP